MYNGVQRKSLDSLCFDKIFKEIFEYKKEKNHDTYQQQVCS